MNIRLSARFVRMAQGEEKGTILAIVAPEGVPEESCLPAHLDLPFDEVD